MKYKYISKLFVYILIIFSIYLNSYFSIKIEKNLIADIQQKHLVKENIEFNPFSFKEKISNKLENKNSNKNNKFENKENKNQIKLREKKTLKKDKEKDNPQINNNTNLTADSKSKNKIK
jgi:hypothetical protein